MIRHALPAAVAAACLVAAPAPRPPSAARTDAVTVAAPAKPASLDDLAAADPVALLAECHRRFRAEVRGYRCTLHKQERTGGTLHPPEVVGLAVREEPYAILMRWRSGARGPLGTPIEGVLFVAGANAGKMTVWRPAARLAPLRLLQLDPADDSARSAARYAVSEAGIGHALDRTHRAWSAARSAGTLRAEFLGRRVVPEVGRECLVVCRTSDAPQLDPFRLDEPAGDPARRPSDAFTSVTVMLDPATGAQVGSELRRADGELVGAYFFRDLDLNPAFPPDQFTAEALKRSSPTAASHTAWAAASRCSTRNGLCSSRVAGAWSTAGSIGRVRNPVVSTAGRPGHVSRSRATSTSPSSPGMSTSATASR